MKRFTLLPLGCVCALAYTTSAFAAEAAADAATESVDPSVSGVLPEEGSNSDAGDPAADSDALEESGSSNEREAKNAIYLDLAGPGLFYSINYDRVIVDDVSARIGFSYLSIGASADSGSGTTASAEFSYIAIPITASYLGLGSESNMFEVGGGGIIMNFKGSGLVESSDASAGASASHTTLGLTAMAGYRHQPADGGFVFRIGASPVMPLGAGFLPWGYMSLGAAF
jgi:hypothetical protein